MTTKFATASAKGSAKESYATAKSVTAEAMRKLGKRPDLAIVYCDVNYNAGEVLRGVREATGNAPLIGCTSNGEFTENGSQMGTISLGIISSDDIRFFPALVKNVKDDPDSAVEDLKNRLPSEVKGFPYKYGIICMDSLTGMSEEIVLNVHLAFPEMALVGGGAADISMEEPLVFASGNAASDAIAMCAMFSKKKMGMSVTHGMTPSFGPLRVTKVKDNVVLELNNRPAWDAWKDIVAEDAKKNYGIDLSQVGLERAMSILLIHYLLALKIDENNYKIRGVSWVTNEGGLVFMCGVADNSEFHVMGYDKEGLIKAAKDGAKAAVKDLGTKPAGALIFDCAARGSILDKEFIKEAMGIGSVLNTPVLGFEAMGEICMAPGQFSGFHNATVVTLALPE
jgi:methyl-accepting chemotaxis protein